MVCEEQHKDFHFCPTPAIPTPCPTRYPTPHPTKESFQKVAAEVMGLISTAVPTNAPTIPTMAPTSSSVVAGTVVIEQPGIHVEHSTNNLTRTPTRDPCPAELNPSARKICEEQASGKLPERRRLSTSGNHERSRKPTVVFQRGVLKKAQEEFVFTVRTTSKKEMKRLQHNMGADAFRMYLKTVLSGHSLGKVINLTMTTPTPHYFEDGQYSQETFKLEKIYLQKNAIYQNSLRHFLEKIYIQKKAPAESKPADSPASARFDKIEFVKTLIKALGVLLILFGTRMAVRLYFLAHDAAERNQESGSGTSYQAVDLNDEYDEKGERNPFDSTSIHDQL
jgi:hypothetical protein